MEKNNNTLNKDDIDKKVRIEDSSDNKEEKKFVYCSNCGEKIMPNSKFCNYCGTPTNNTKNEEDEAEKKNYKTNKEELTERKMVYEGKLHKCPNCGELLDSFISNCPTCGYELRDSKNSNAVEELSRKLEEIEGKRDKKKASAKILGALNLSIGLTEIDEQKISLIRNFPIPNTKEDLYEFLILSKSNIEIDAYENTEIKSARLAMSEAWKAKFEQAYQKAKIIFKKDDRMIEINKMNEELNKSINSAKWKQWKIAGIFLGVFLLFLIVILIIGAALGWFSKNNSKSNNLKMDDISVIENNNISINENIEENDNKSKNEIKSSVILGDNIVGSNNEYLEIKEAGYTRLGKNLTCVVKIANNSKKAIEFPSFRVTAYDKEGKILGSEERILSLLYPNNIIVDQGARIEVSEEPDKVEVIALEPDKSNIKDVNVLEHPQYNEMQCINISVKSDKVTGEVYNPNNYKIEQAKIIIVFRDDNNKIIISEDGFVNNVPANGKVPFDITIHSKEKVNDNIEANVCIW